MSFANMIFLLGGAAVAGPILAHLLARPRYRRLPFTMLAFLQVSTKDVQARRKLRNLLLLLLRCLIIVVIAMLFAGPRAVTSTPVEQPTTMYFVALDDSISMAYDDGASYFSALLDEAARVIDEAGEGAVFNVYAMASGRWHRSLPAAAARAALTRLRPVPRKAVLGDFLDELAAARRRSNGKVKVAAVIISDFTPAVLAELAAVEQPILVDSALHIDVRPAGPVTNTGIAGARLARIDKEGMVVTADLENSGAKPVERLLVATWDGGEAETAVALEPSEKKAVDIAVAADARPGAAGGDENAFESDVRLELSLSPSDPLAVDDKYYLAAALPETRRTRVVLFGARERDIFLLKTAVETIGSQDPFTVVDCSASLYRSFTPALLREADVAMFAGADGVLAEHAGQIASFVSGGGRAVFFLSEDSTPAALDALSTGGVLAASLGQFRRENTGPAAAPCAADGLAALDRAGGAATAFLKYRLEDVLLAGFFECEPAETGEILWELRTGEPFLVLRRAGDGWSLLVNTSADDSLGALTKSPAAVAFCRLLVGGAAPPVSRSFICGETITLPALPAEVRDAGRGRPVWVLKPSGEAVEAAVSEGLVAAACRDEVGWLSTVAKPVRAAGVNLPPGETDMSRADAETVSRMVARVIAQAPMGLVEAGEAESGGTYLPIWRYFAWLALALVLIEVFIANRTQR